MVPSARSIHSVLELWVPVVLELLLSVLVSELVSVRIGAVGVGAVGDYVGVCSVGHGAVGDEAMQ